MISSVLGKRTEVTEDRSDQGPKWLYTVVSNLSKKLWTWKSWKYCYSWITEFRLFIRQSLRDSIFLSVEGVNIRDNGNRTIHWQINSWSVKSRTGYSRTGRFADWSTCRQRICKHPKCQMSHLKLSAGVQRGPCIQVLAVYAVSWLVPTSSATWEAAAVDDSQLSWCCC